MDGVNRSVHAHAWADPAAKCCHRWYASQLRTNTSWNAAALPYTELKWALRCVWDICVQAGDKYDIVAPMCGSRGSMHAGWLPSLTLTMLTQ